MSLLWDLALALQITTKARRSLISPQSLQKQKTLILDHVLKFDYLSLSFLSLGFVLYHIMLVDS